MEKLKPSENSNYKTYVIYRITSRAIKNPNGCLEYKGKKCTTKHPYGLISITWRGKRKNVPAHRALYMATHDLLELPRATQIRHKCDNPRCVNLEHLEPGTALDNMQDCLERGRRAKKYKPHTRQRKLTDEQVIDIKSAKLRPFDYCLKYKITNSYVSKLQSGIAKPLLNAA